MTGARKNRSGVPVAELGRRCKVFSLTVVVSLNGAHQLLLTGCELRRLGTRKVLSGLSDTPESTLNVSLPTAVSHRIAWVFDRLKNFIRHLVVGHMVLAPDTLNDVRGGSPELPVRAADGPCRRPEQLITNRQNLRVLRAIQRVANLGKAAHRHPSGCTVIRHNLHGVLKGLRVQWIVSRQD